MAEFVNTAYIGDINVRPTGWDDPSDEDKQFWKLQTIDPATMKSVNHHIMHIRPPSFIVLDLYIITSVAAGSTGDSCRIKAPYPLQIQAIDLGCESAAGASGTMDVYTDDGTTDASILDAPEDVQTTAGTAVRVAPEDAFEEVAYDTDIYVQGASGGGGVMVGGQAHLYCQRL